MAVAVVHPETLIRAGKLHITAWNDKSVDPYGHDPRSAYVEQFWLSTLGPSTTWFLRVCAKKLDSSSNVTIDLADLAQTLGIGYRKQANSAMARTIVRACKFGMARPESVDTLAVRQRIPPLTYQQLERLPASLRRLHEEYVITDVANEYVNDNRRRARRLALGLVECGDSPDNAEQQLGHWQFQPSVAADAVRWAWKQHRHTNHSTKIG